MTEEGTLLLSRGDVESLLSLEDCIAAVENAFRLHAEGKSLKPGLMHIDTADGEFHVKAGGLKLDRSYFGVKINGGFFRNEKKFGLPNIQGLILLSDAENGRPLAIMDSVAITRIRTGAATAVAAKYLARANSNTVTICGCGTQGRVQLRALKHVLPIKQAYAFSRDEDRASEFADEMSEELGIVVSPTSDLRGSVTASDVVITCTPSRVPFLKGEYISRGTFIAAVGADSPDKQEIDPSLMASSKVVTDITRQCENVGELHHAIDDGLMTPKDVYAEIGEIICGNKLGRTTDNEITIFDSTGTALQDIAAAAVVIERATELGIGARFDLSQHPAEGTSITAV